MQFHSFICERGRCSQRVVERIKDESMVTDDTKDVPIKDTRHFGATR